MNTNVIKMHRLIDNINCKKFYLRGHFLFKLLFLFKFFAEVIILVVFKHTVFISSYIVYTLIGLIHIMKAAFYNSRVA